MFINFQMANVNTQILTNAVIRLQTYLTKIEERVNQLAVHVQQLLNDKANNGASVQSDQSGVSVQAQKSQAKIVQPVLGGDDTANTDQQAVDEKQPESQ